MRAGVSLFAVAALTAALIATAVDAGDRVPASWTVGATVAGVVVQIIDGDTLRVRDVAGSADVRLHGIDAPESDQRCTTAAGAAFLCGEAAARQLADLLGASPVSCSSSRLHGICLAGVPVRCEVLGVDRRWQRPVARCFQGATDLAREMVRRGYARSSYSHDYDLLAIGARLQSRGLWAGTWEDPASHRRQHGAR